jgi:hypothetical protein
MKCNYIFNANHLINMGRSEHVNAYIGIKISLSDLISQMNESNFKLINEMLCSGFIEDSYDNFNNVYSNIFDDVYESYISDNNVEKLKEYLTNAFTVATSYYIFNGQSQPNIYDGNLIDQYLLVPIKKLLENIRYGYDIDGINGTSRKIDFDLSVNVEKYKEINNYEIVFMLKQFAW